MHSRMARRYILVNSADVQCREERGIMMQPLRLAIAALVCFVGCDAIRNSPRPLAKSATLDVHLVSSSPTPGSKEATDPETKAGIFLTMPAIISAVDVATVQRIEHSGMPSLAIKMTPTGAQKLGAATSKSKVMQIAFVVDGTVVATPVLRTSISTEFVVQGGEISKNIESLFAALTIGK
jgi:preprotein translocase subunit SecD